MAKVVRDGTKMSWVLDEDEEKVWQQRASTRYSQEDNNALAAETERQGKAIADALNSDKYKDRTFRVNLQKQIYTYQGNLARLKNRGYDVSAAIDQTKEIQKASDEQTKFFNQFKTENDYNDYVARQKDYQEKLSYDTVSAQKELDDLNAQFEEAKRLRTEYDRYISGAMADPAKATSAQTRLNSLLKRYGYSDIEEMEKDISGKNQYLTLSKRIQDSEKLRNDALGASDFKEFSEMGASIENPSFEDAENAFVIFGKTYGGADIGNIVTYSRENWEGLAMGEGNGTTMKGRSIYRYMTKEEVSIYNYYLAKEGEEKADEYLDSIEEELNYREATGIYDRVLEGNTAIEVVFGAMAGLDQAASGFRSLFSNSGDYVPASSVQIAGQLARENLADAGPNLPEWAGGASLGQLAYDFTSTSANMAPSYLVSALTGSPLLGSIVLGASAAGNAYQEKINLGYSKDQARAYARLIGASEMGLQYLLGGISKLGGKVSNNFVNTLISNVDNAFARTALKLGGNMASEFTEEYLQDVLTPWFENLTLYTENDVKLYTPDYLYSGLMGALTAGFMEGPSTVSGEVQTYKTGKTIQKSGFSTERLAKLGQTFSADSVAYRLAGKVDENTGAYTIGRLFNEIGATLTEQNQSEIIKSLERKGVSHDDAVTISETLAAVVEGASITERQAAALEANDAVSKTIMDVIVNPNSTVNQRTQNYNEALMALAQEKAKGRKGASKAAEPQELAGSETTPAEVKSTTDTKAAPERMLEASVDGKTINNKTGEEVKIESIASIQNGEMMLKLDSGETVNARDVSYASEGDALIYETVARLDTNAAAANQLVQAYDPAMSAEVYARGIEEAYRYGMYNIPVSEMMDKGSFSVDLTAVQRNTAYRLGQIFGGKAIAREQATVRKNRAVGKSSTTEGKVHFDGDRNALNERQSASLSAMEKIADALGIQIYIFESKEVDGKRQGANGWFDPKDSSIHIDLYAGQNGEATMLFTAAHELTHFIRKWSPAKFKVLANFLMEQYGKKGVSVDTLVQNQIAKAKKNGRDISYDTAYEEVIADSMETMLSDGKVAEKLALLKAKDKSLWGKIKEFFSDLMAKIQEVYKGMKPNSTEGQYVAEMKDALERIQELFAEGLVEASENYQSSLSVGEDSAVYTESGDPVAYASAEGSVLLSMRTYEEEGRSAFREYLEKCVSSNRLTKTEMQEMLDGIEDIYQTCKQFKDKYAPFGTWSDASVVRDTYGRPVFSVVTPNGEYKMNLDFSLVCKKRRTLDAVFNEMSRRGIIDNFELGQKSVVKINEIIRKHGFETACALCFVDAKRFRRASMADQFVSLYNELVKSLVPESKQGSIGYFNFAGNAKVKKTSGSIDTWQSADLDFTHIDEVLSKYGKGTVEYKSAKYIKANAEARQLLQRGDFMSSAGFDAVKSQNSTILKLYNSKKGTGGPKAAFGDVQYMNEIIRNAKRWTPAKAYAVGGVRVQSFSDYVPRMVFDYVQMVYDLAATGLPAHAYTKEALFAKQFGLTGIKINMSLIPAIAKDGISPGLDANGNYVWAGESFDFETAKDIQNAEGYTENCGTICVGVSDLHIRKLLEDPDIRMVIPYHKSGLNPIVAHMNRIAEFKDYTSSQNTLGRDGKKVSKDFDFNAALHKMGENADPKAVINQYLEWCDSQGYTPRFSQFRDNPNYYKLIEDFTLYDKNGQYVPQREVRAVFPGDGSAFGTMKSLIESGLQEDAVIEGKRDKTLASIVDEIEQSIPKTEAEIEETEVKQADRDLESEFADAGVKIEESGRVKYSFRGYAEDGKGIYESNFQKGTPKKAKSEKILSYIQNVWSKKPIRLKIEDSAGTRYIEARFDPTYDESGNIPTDASKIMGGNRHGTSAEQRVTLDLADDYYKIASESSYNYSKDETGKLTYTHKNVKIWHYFINDIYFAEYGSNELSPYRVSINVKETSDGNFFYSFSAEKEKGISSQRTLHAAVNSKDAAKGNPYDEMIPQPDPAVKRSDRDYVEYDRTAILTESKIDEYLEDYAAKSSPKYAQAYIAYMRPKDFLKLTTADMTERYHIAEQSGDLDEESLRKSRPGIYLRIDHETGEVTGHEGRHRMSAMWKSGIEYVPVLLVDTSNKMTKSDIDDLFLHGQFDVTAISIVHGAIPLSYENRERVIKKFATQSSTQRIGEKYGHNKTLRFQDRSNDFEKVNQVLEKENAKLKEDVSYLKELLKLQKTVTGGTKFTRSSVEAAAGQLMEYAGARGDKAELAKLLNDLYEYIAKGDDLTWESVRSAAAPAVEWLMDNANNTGSFNLGQKVFSFENDLSEQELMRQVYDSYWNVSTLRTVADVKQKQINALKFHHMNRMQELQEGHKENTEKLKREYQEKINRLRKEYRDTVISKQEKMKVTYRESRERSVEGRKKTVMRNKIKNVVNELNTYLLKGTKDKHVMIGLQKAVAEALDVVNMDTVGAEQRLAKLNEDLVRAKTPEKIKEIMGKIQRVEAMGDKMNDRLNKLKTAYAEIKDSNDPLIANSHDEVIEASIESVANSVGDTALRDMSLSQLEDVYDLYKMVLTRIRDANKTFANNKKESIDRLASNTQMEVELVGGKKKFGLKSFGAVNSFLWNNLKPVYAFKAIGSKTLTGLFDNVRAGEDTWARDVSEARAFYMDQSKKHGYDSWDLEKTYSFRSTSGMDFKLNLEQMMSIYAYSKRSQAEDHLKYGGIVLENSFERKNLFGKFSIKLKTEDATAYNISPETLSEIIGKLTSEQKAFVDQMQDYLSTTMGAKGNEVSFEMYGVKLFKEKFYFPLKSAQQYMAKAREQANGEVKIKNSGFTKETNPHAKNPIVLEGFMDVWANHVNDMSMYHAFTLPLEDFYRVYNYRTPSNNENMPTEGVNPAIENAYGKAATRYIEQLLKDLNGGARSDPAAGYLNKMMGPFKKGAVFASASVVIQQPSAIARALALVDSKYFVGKKMDSKKHAALWEEVKKYAPVAIIKEMGYFDTNMGKSTVDFIKAKEYESWGEKMKALVKDSGYRDEVLSKAPALADELAWCQIWEAVKRETLDKTSLKPESEEFLKKAGERFTEVIVNTQVYDSVLSRSANMRSKDTGMEMVTAFLAEPTTSINMIADALIQGKRGNRKYARSAIGAVIASQILNAILVSFVYAGRDDDEDETYWEKYLGSLTAEIKDSFNLFSYIPFVKDIVSIVQGYDVERSDISVISDLWKAGKQLFSDNLSTYRKVENFAGSIAQLFGLPVRNIMRDARGLYQTVNSFMNGQKTTGAGVKYAVMGAITNQTISDGQQLYEAMLNDDAAHAARVRSRFKDQSAVDSAIRKALRENDPRIHEAAVARYNGDIAEYTRIAKEIIAEGHFGQDYVVSAISTEMNTLDKDDSTSTASSKVSGLYNSDDFASAILNGDSAMANAIKTDIIQTAQKNGKTAEEAEKSFISSASSACRELYEAGDLTEHQAVIALETYCGKTAEEAASKVQYWDFKQNYPGYDLSEEAVNKYYTDLEHTGISMDAYCDYYVQRAECEGVDADNDGKTDSGSVKAEVMVVIDSLPITSEQKDALYFLNGWAASKLYEAPWH